MLRSAGKDNVIGAVRAATEVAISVDPLKALAAVDAGLEALETASTADLINVVKAGRRRCRLDPSRLARNPFQTLIVKKITVIST